MLKGKRVTLRAVERDDAPRMRDIMQNVDLVLLGFGAWSPRSVATIERTIERMREHGDPWFAIEIDGVLVGECGLHDIEQRSRVAALGVGIYDPAYVGKGYGREVCTLLLDWAFTIHNYRRIWLDTWASNQRAIRLYRALGFVEEARLRRHIFVNGVYEDVVLMGLLRDEWQANQGEASNA